MVFASTCEDASGAFIFAGTEARIVIVIFFTFAFVGDFCEKILTCIGFNKTSAKQGNIHSAWMFPQGFPVLHKWESNKV